MFIKDLSLRYSQCYCHSWGCHTGKAMSEQWKKAAGLWMVGAHGKTDYTGLHLRNNQRGLSSGVIGRSGASGEPTDTPASWWKS